MVHCIIIYSIVYKRKLLWIVNKDCLKKWFLKDDCAKKLALIDNSILGEILEIFSSIGSWFVYVQVCFVIRHITMERIIPYAWSSRWFSVIESKMRSKIKFCELLLKPTYITVV